MERGIGQRPKKRVDETPRRVADSELERPDVGPHILRPGKPDAGERLGVPIGNWTKKNKGEPSAMRLVGRNELELAIHPQHCPLSQLRDELS